MCQNNCCCNGNYALQVANTGVAAISAANGNLDGSGSSSTVLTAGLSGTILKSVTVKASNPTTKGMVRLFIGNGAETVLYKEIPIPVTPELENTPTPSPVLPLTEIKLSGDLKLKSGDTLIATTQVSNSFNVIAEGLDWNYPQTLPDSDFNYKQEVANTGIGVVSTANSNTDGTGSIKDIFTSGQLVNGSTIKSIAIKALQSTSINGMIRLFIKPSGGSYSLMREIPIPETEQSAYEPSYKVVINEPFNLAADYVIGASTQNPESFGITIEGADWTYAIS